MAQEETVVRRFRLDRATPEQATATVVQAVQAALGGTYERMSDTAFSGTGHFIAQRGNALDRKTGSEFAHMIDVKGTLKAHENGDFSVLIAMNHAGLNWLGKFFAFGVFAGFVFYPLLVAGLGLLVFRGSSLAALVGAGLGFLIALGIARAFGQLPQKAMRGAREAVEAKLSTVEFYET